MIRNKRYLIITSADYIDQQLQSEFGKIPPSFLPIGNKRLYEYQSILFNNYFNEIYLTLPKNFKLNEIDKANLKDKNIKLVYIPNGLSLGDSLIFLIEKLKIKSQALALIHGDSYITNFDFKKIDSVTVNKSPEIYDWGNVELENSSIKKLYDSKYSDEIRSSNVLSGWFSFSDSNFFLKCLKKNKGNFIKGIFEYSKKIKIFIMEPEIWLDFGHINKFYESRKFLTTQRYFNDVEIENNIVKKSSKLFSKKIQAEINWYINLPSSLAIHTPKLLDYDLDPHTNYYNIQYLNYPSLSEIFVFGKLRLSSWKKIFNSISDVLDNFSNFTPNSDILKTLNMNHVYKASIRFEQFLRTNDINENMKCKYNGKKFPSLKQIIKITSEYITPFASKDCSLIHGDFCFSNIFYDNRSNLIYLIDPRGMDFDENITGYGDRRYEIAKLYHSIIGRYDHIIANQFHLSINSALDYDLEFFDNKYYNDISNEFLLSNNHYIQYNDPVIKAIAILIFISMLPFHNDNYYRQNAIIANTLRLFEMLD